MTTYTHCTVLAAGCHGRVSAPVVSRHRSLAAAIRKASGNDRLEVRTIEASDFGDIIGDSILFALPAQGHPRLGAGRYGLGE